ncbi:MAG: carbon starvation CstA family protein, partial [Muribaculaceae bacterium]
PEFTEGLQNRQPNPDALPIFPMMFISIACGAISGFHATQSPLMARCMKNEKYARPVFYGAMVTEGIVALIWAAAAVAFAGSFDGLAELLGTQKPARIVYNLSTQWLGMAGGLLAMLGVIFAPITSGDTALRSARLIVMETFKIKSNSIAMRLLVSVALFAVTFVILNIDFTVLWRYFAWSNQTLSVFTLWTITVYLARHSKPYLVTLIPAVFMTMVTTTYISFAPEGLRLGWIVSIVIASVVSILFCGLFVRFLNSIKKERKL